MTGNRHSGRKLVRDAGVVGAGGAGFPTHVKLEAKAGLVIANGAECEPLLCTDQTLMRFMADRVVLGLEAAMRAVGATRGVIATKKHYHDAVQAISHALTGRDALSLFLMDSYYPAGDEKSLIHEVTGEVVRSAKLPAGLRLRGMQYRHPDGILRTRWRRPVLERKAAYGLRGCARPCRFAGAGGHSHARADRGNRLCGG